MRTNYYLSKLSSNMQVKMSTKTELKSGQMRERLSIQVINPVGAEDYNTASGGEKKRLDVAMIMALRDLIQWQSGANRMDLFVADEVFDSLDENGASRLCELLREMAGLVFVVSHNEDLKKYFPNIIKVRKKCGISEVIQ
jgi:DNA repair exonuclease SbcCD ATPase subunit